MQEMQARSLVFDAASRLKRVRFVMVVLVLFALLMDWLALDAAISYGSSPGDGGVLAPLITRLLIAGMISGLGLAPLLGMLLYGRCYVVRIEHDRASDVLFVTTWLGGARDQAGIAWSALEGATEHRGEMPDSSTQRAPWTSLRVHGRQLPYLVDMQGQVVDESAWRRIVQRAES